MPTMASINIATPTRIAIVFFIYPNPFPISKRVETLYAYDELSFGKLLSLLNIFLTLPLFPVDDFSKSDDSLADAGDGLSEVRLKSPGWIIFF
jgi:hypothetical protein